MHAFVHPVHARPARRSFTLDRAAQSATLAAVPPGDRVPSCRDEDARLRDLRHPQEKVRAVLLGMGAIVRDGNALGRSGWARVGVGTQEEIEFFLRKLASLEGGAQEAGEGRPS